MPEFRDDLDAWLHGHVQPLLPPPGTFELVRKRARRRKVRRVALSVAATAAVVAVAATVPQVLVSQFSSGRETPSALVGRGHTPGSSTAPGSTPTSPLATGQTPVTTAPAFAPVPTPFSPASVTFVGDPTGDRTGWVIGQAGIPGQCATQYCTSIARTDDAGKTWYGVHAPVTGPPYGSHGVGQIRFLDRDNGWAFGPQLWATHDSGQSWRRIGTRGMRVTALETRGNRAFAVWAQCSGAGPDFAADCTNFVLYSAYASSDNWTPVAGTWSDLSLIGTAGSAALVLTETAGYLLPPGGVLFSGPISGSGTWQPTTGASAPRKVPCDPGAAQPNGQPSQAMIASTGPQPYLALLCAGTPAGTTQTKTLYYSADGGKTWQPGGAVPGTGVAMSLSGSPSGGLVLATNQGIETAGSVTGPWQPAGGSLPAGGFAYVGMTTANQGVAVPDDAGLHAVWFTYDGGMRWRKSPVR